MLYYKQKYAFSTESRHLEKGNNRRAGKRKESEVSRGKEIKIQVCEK